jgi:hypothetical protein
MSFKNKAVFFVLALVVGSTLVMGTYVHAASNQTTYKKPDFSTIQSSVEKMLDSRISQYTAFASAAASSTISSSDQAIILGEIDAAIPHMQTSVTAVQNATDTASIIKAERQGSAVDIQSDSLLQDKMSLLNVVFRTASRQSRVVINMPRTASSTTYAMDDLKISSSTMKNRRMASSTYSRPQRPFQISTATTTTITLNPLISADIVHQIINATSFQDISALDKEVFGILFPKKSAN